MLDHGRGSHAVHVPLPCHITHHKAAAIWGPVTIYQLDVVCPAAVHVRPGVLCREAAWHRLLGQQEAAKILRR